MRLWSAAAGEDGSTFEGKKRDRRITVCEGRNKYEKTRRRVASFKNKQPGFLIPGSGSIT